MMSVREVLCRIDAIWSWDTPFNLKHRCNAIQIAPNERIFV